MTLTHGDTPTPTRLDELELLLRAGESIPLSIQRCGWRSIASVRVAARRNDRDDLLALVQPETDYLGDQQRMRRATSRI